MQPFHPGPAATHSLTVVPQVELNEVISFGLFVMPQGLLSITVVCAYGMHTQSFVHQITFEYLPPHSI